MAIDLRPAAHQAGAYISAKNNTHLKRMYIPK